MDYFTRYVLGLLILAAIGSIVIVISINNEKRIIPGGFFSAQGRLSRLPFILSILGIAGIEKLLANSSFTLLYLLFIPLEVVKWVVIVERMHDLNKPAKEAFKAFIPFYPIYLMFEAGSVGPNHFGFDPIRPDLKEENLEIVEDKNVFYFDAETNVNSEGESLPSAEHHTTETIDPISENVLYQNDYKPLIIIGALLVIGALVYFYNESSNSNQESNVQQARKALDTTSKSTSHSTSNSQLVPMNDGLDENKLEIYQDLAIRVKKFNVQILEDASNFQFIDTEKLLMTIRLIEGDCKDRQSTLDSAIAMTKDYGDAARKDGSQVQFWNALIENFECQVKWAQKISQLRIALNNYVKASGVDAQISSMEIEQALHQLRIADSNQSRTMLRVQELQKK